MEVSPNNVSPGLSQFSRKPLSADDKINQLQPSIQTSTSEKTPPEENTNQQKKTSTDSQFIKQGALSLDDVELKKVEGLKKRDTEVRAHEASHLAAAGKHATGGASFEYERGPDGRSYAVSGEVRIDTSPVANDPAATLQKAQQIQAAAQAPANPSAQDRQVAASAAAMAADARAELAQQKLTVDETSSTDKPKNDADKTMSNASKEYQSVAKYTEDVVTPLLNQIA